MGYFPDDSWLFSLKLFSKDGAVVLQTGWDWAAHGDCKTHTEHLNDGERVIGYKSRSIPLFYDCAYHRDF
jgi:hypothetical protein